MALPLVGICAVVVLWELAALTGRLPASVPALNDTLGNLSNLVMDPAFIDYLVHTVRAWAVGFSCAVFIALPLGILLGLNARCYAFFRVPLEAIRPIPPIVILPLALLVVGGGAAFQTALIVQGAMWPLLLTVVYGIRETDIISIETARSFHLGRWRTVWFVRLPAAAATIASGVRLAAATAFAVTIVTEIVGGARGIGTRLMIASSGGDTETVYAVTVMAGLVGLVITLLFRFIERRFLDWQAV